MPLWEWNEPASPRKKLRRGRFPAQGLSFVAVEDTHLVGTVRLWNVRAAHDYRPGGVLLLGPLAVMPGHDNKGIGSKLMTNSLSQAADLGHGAVVLVGDLGYYGRFGFTMVETGTISMPGPYDPDRFLMKEIQPGFLAGLSGRLRATGRRSIPRRALPDPAVYRSAS